MPTLNLVAELTLDDLLAVVAKLDEAELTEFEIRFEQLRLARSTNLDDEAARVAAVRRLSPVQQIVHMERR